MIKLREFESRFCIKDRCCEILIPKLSVHHSFISRDKRPYCPRDEMLLIDSTNSTFGLVCSCLGKYEFERFRFDVDDDVVCYTHTHKDYATYLDSTGIITEIAYSVCVETNTPFVVSNYFRGIPLRRSSVIHLLYYVCSRNGCFSGSDVRRRVARHFRYFKIWGVTADDRHKCL
ncbi:MAG: hypothetical protein KatS3mg087_0472 [Patescibacteria group bacterium]|nr:MAG: hypothetical protein KatS3mg087_0472 [Patescibacteria group bacterium]